MKYLGTLVQMRKPSKQLHNFLRCSFLRTNNEFWTLIHDHQINTVFLIIFPYMMIK